MAENENGVTMVDDLVGNIARTSSNLETAEPGTQARKIESDIYDTQLSQIEKFERLELEKRKQEAEEKNAELRHELEAAKEKKQAIQFGVDTGVKLFRTIASLILGIASLKYNLKYGGLNDRDMKGWFNDLLKRD